MSAPVDRMLPRPGDRRFFLNEGPVRRETLNRLPHVPEFAARWHGVVHCGRYGTARPNAAGWDECGLSAGPFQFFGDPVLLARIRDVLRE